MGGYGFYIWISYASVILILGIQLIRAVLRFRSLRRNLMALLITRQHS